MDDTIITNPGDVILIKLGKDKQKGFYACITNVTADIYKRGWWSVRFFPFVLAPDSKLHEVEWKLDDQQIRGEEFTIDNHVYQMFKSESININPDAYKEHSPANKVEVKANVEQTTKVGWEGFNPVRRKLTPKSSPRIKREIPPYLRLVRNEQEIMEE